MWTTIRAYNTKRFRVALQWAPEEDEDLSWMDDTDLHKITTGEWTNCCFRVIVYLDGREVATDYLGNSVYADPSEFAREHFGVNHESYGRGYFSDMLREATAAARKAVRETPAPPRVRAA